MFFLFLLWFFFFFFFIFLLYYNTNNYNNNISPTKRVRHPTIATRVTVNELLKSQYYYCYTYTAERCPTRTDLRSTSTNFNLCQINLFPPKLSIFENFNITRSFHRYYTFNINIIYII